MACEKIKGRRLYENGITFTPHLKLLTASNQMVAFRETNDAILDRIVVLFMHSTLRHDQLDRELLEKVYAERDVIFSLAVDTLPDLIKSGYDFQMPDESTNFLAACRTQIHSVENFIKDRCEIREDAEIPTTTLHDAYQKYCNRNGFEPVGRNAFYEQIQWHGESGISRKRCTIWTNFPGGKDILSQLHEIKAAVEQNSIDSNINDQLERCADRSRVLLSGHA